MTEVPIHAAIVGSGPSGFYAAEALAQSIRDVWVDMYERLPTPFGLVRSGVAPDHPKLKDVTTIFERIMCSEHFRFVGNVDVGIDVGVPDLRANYHLVILACGASCDRKMGIPGEGLAQCHSASDFVGWYNGHPDSRDLTFDLSQETAVVIGHGNVAADVCRILLQPAAALHSTDIAAHALEALSESRVREVHLVGRRGPAQAKFTPKELRGLGSIAGCAAISEAHALNEASAIEIADRLNVNAAKNVDLFRSFIAPTEASARRLVFRFCLDPLAVEGDGRVERVVFRRNRLDGRPFEQRAAPTAETDTIDCGLVFASIGYRGRALDGVPFDEKLGIVPSDRGRVLDGGGSPGLYVTGWLKRGPTGIIGTNRADSIETVQRVLEDLPELLTERREGSKRILPRLSETGLRIVAAEDWRAIDTAERERGAEVGKPREKYTRIADMLLRLDTRPLNPPMGERQLVGEAGTREAF